MVAFLFAPCEGKSMTTAVYEVLFWVWLGLLGALLSALAMRMNA